MTLSSDEVRHVARLARLALGDEDIERFRIQLSQILDHAARVSEIAAEGLEPTSHPLPIVNVFRDDVVAACLTQEEALSTAPEVEDGRFKVPRIIEEA